MEEKTGRDGGRRPFWSYRRHEWTGTGSSSYTVSSSSRSGTIVSTTYTSSASRHSSISMEAALQLELSLGTPWIGTDTMDAESAQPIKRPHKETEETFKEKRMKHVKSMVQEFFCERSANYSIQGGNVNVLERWFTELRVGWVLRLAEDETTWELGHPSRDDMWSWIRALTAIVETIRDTKYFFLDHGYDFVGMPGISEEEEELPPKSGKQATSLYPLQFTLFIQQTMSKMLVFVDAIISKSRYIQGIPCTPPSLHIRLDVHGALSRALSEIRLHFDPLPSAEVERIENEIVSLLSTKQGKMFENIWSTLEDIRTRIMSMEDSSGTQTPQESSNIHKATYSVMKHINFLLDNHYTVTPLVSQAISLGKYVPQIGEGPPFISLITEMVSCLEENLITKSQLFLDEGLRFLFLLNNSNFIPQQLRHSYIRVDTAAVSRKVKYYRESYIQVSWAPMLSCLSNHTPLCLGRNHSPLSKFDSEFQKTYTTQKLWKVPDPWLRKGLRIAIMEKIIPGYTKYIEDIKVTNPKFTPQKLAEMLQDLFEG